MTHKDKLVQKVKQGNGERKRSKMTMKIEEIKR